MGVIESIVGSIFGTKKSPSVPTPPKEPDTIKASSAAKDRQRQRALAGVSRKDTILTQSGTGTTGAAPGTQKSLLGM